MISIIKATKISQYKDIENLAKIIWNEHYTPIIGKDQVQYMLDNFQSAKAIEEAVKMSGYEYYIAKADGKDAGYISIQVKEDENSLFLSKLYVLKEMRGHGVGKFCIDECVKIAKSKNLSRIYLTVNKNNYNSISAYEKMGFVKVKEIKQDIGAGFVMDDYVYEYVLMKN